MNEEEDEEKYATNSTEEDSSRFSNNVHLKNNTNKDKEKKSNSPSNKGNINLSEQESKGEDEEDEDEDDSGSNFSEYDSGDDSDFEKKKKRRRKQRTISQVTNEEDSAEENNNDEEYESSVGGKKKNGRGRKKAKLSKEDNHERRKTKIDQEDEEDVQGKEEEEDDGDDDKEKLNKRESRTDSFDGEVLSISAQKRLKDEAIAAIVLESQLDKEVVNETFFKELLLLEARAKAVANAEWELDCQRKSLEHKEMKDKAASSLRVLKQARVNLVRMKEEIEIASKLFPDLHASNDCASRFISAYGVLESFIIGFEKKLHSNISAPPPEMPPSPKKSEYLKELLNIDDIEIEDSPLRQLVDLNASRYSPQSPSGGPKKKHAKRQSIVVNKEKPTQRLETHMEALEITKVLGEAGEEESLYKLKFSFPCEELTSKLRPKFEAAVKKNGFKSLRANFQDLKAPTFPTKIETSLNCLPPLASGAGRLPTCGLCGLAVRRDDYRGRGIKNGTTSPCLVHCFHSYCLAYLQITCKSVCIANLMGVASPCNLNERRVN